jgi:tetratricopeptide (TPR) repeat protein
MSGWRIATGFCLLAAGLAVAQTTGSPDSKNEAPASGETSPSPFGLPPPFQPKADTPKPEASETAIPKSEMPPEEDKSDAPKVFSFNPVQSQKEVNAGDFYFKKGNYTAAVSRYDEATKWNDGNAEAWLRLGEAQEKKSNAKAAREAYQKYLEVAPTGKDAAEIRKRLAKLKG